MNTDNREQREKEKWVGLEKKMKGTDDGDKAGATVAHGRRKRKERRRRRRMEGGEISAALGPVWFEGRGGKGKGGETLPLFGLKIGGEGA